LDWKAAVRDILESAMTSGTAMEASLTRHLESNVEVSCPPVKPTTIAGRAALLQTARQMRDRLGKNFELKITVVEPVGPRSSSSRMVAKVTFYLPFISSTLPLFPSFIFVPSSSFPSPSLFLIFLPSTIDICQSKVPTYLYFLPSFPFLRLPSFPSSSPLHLPSFIFLPSLHLPSFIFLHLPSFIFLHLPSSSFTFLHLPSPSFIFLPSSSFTFLHLPSPSFLPSFIFLHLPSPSFAFLHLPSSIFLPSSSFTFLHLPSFLSIF
jgi:hypothetical protein